MLLRIPLMVLALVFVNVPWLAATLLLLSVPLPWMAVLIANDAPPRKAENAHRLPRSRPMIESNAADRLHVDGATPGTR